MASVNLGIQADVNSRNIQGWKLGTEASRITDNDIHKAVVLDTSSEATMKLASAGEEIRGFVEAIETHTADGQTYGSIFVHAKGVREWVTGKELALGDLVVADTQTGNGVANAVLKHPQDQYGLTPVKKGTPTTFKWQVIRVVGTDRFLIEAI